MRDKLLITTGPAICTVRLRVCLAQTVGKGSLVEWK
jgi:hypothetical protein